MIAWGSICIAHVAIRGSTTFLALRLLLGATEAGFTPTEYYYMSTFYPKFSLGFRMGLFSGMYSIAGAFAGLLAYGLLHLETSTLRG
jgi:MFS family permease